MTFRGRWRRWAQEHVGTRIKGIAEQVRSRHLLVLDIAGMAIASLMALGISMDEAPTAALAGEYLWVIGIIIAARMAVSLQAGLYRNSWRFASVSAMALIAGCVAGGTLAAATIVALANSFDPSGANDVPPLSFWIAELSITLFFFAAPRFVIRASSEIPSSSSRSVGGAQRTLLYGAGWAGVMVARSAMRDKSAGVLPVGFLDDDKDLAGRNVAGLRVFGGTSALARAARETRADALLITMPTADGNVVREVVDAALELKLKVRTVPPITDLLDGSIDATRLRKVKLEDLLRRPPTQGHTPAVCDLFRDQVVVITGAGGSIGSELARQVQQCSPRRMIMVDRAESPLYLIHRELEDRREKGVANGAAWANSELVTRLMSVASRSLMRRLFEDERPSVVLHAAAYKHVPMMEDHPSEAVQVNIGGTLAVVDAAISAGVKHLVLVSTDKAVRPSSVMGATKRVAEMIVAETAHRSGRPYVSVRFGNVLGSNGSVVPIFQQQLENGEAFTITDPEMTRYFMTIPEAAWLILDAAALAGPRDLFVLDMGDPVRVIDLARDLARLAGRDPDSIPINVVGLRKGEKLHEELFYDEEEVMPTSVPRVMRAEAPLPRVDIGDRARELLAMATGDRDVELAAALHDLVRNDIDSADDAPDARQLGLGLDGGRRVETNLVVVPIHANGNGHAGPKLGVVDGNSRDPDESELSTSGRRPTRS